jgi:hypothetical protein
MRAALILALMASGAAAQNMPAMPAPNYPDCTQEQNRDVLTIEDDGTAVAVLTYGNAAEQCSAPVDQIMTAPNGIQARVVVSVGATGDTREHLTVTPTDPAYIAVPDRLALIDGETGRVRIMLPMF